MKKILTAAALTAAAIGVPLAAAGAAMADSAHGGHVDPGDVVGALDDSCVLPWHWDGALTAGDTVLGTLLQTPVSAQHFEACNSTGQH